MLSPLWPSLALSTSPASTRTFSFKKTPETVIQQPLPPQTVAAAIDIPIRIFILKNDQHGGSSRDTQNAQRIFENTRNIWTQANINLQLNHIESIPMTEDQLVNFRLNPRPFFSTLPEYDHNAINVFFIGVLGENLNGYPTVKREPSLSLTTPLHLTLEP